MSVISEGPKSNPTDGLQELRQVHGRRAFSDQLGAEPAEDLVAVGGTGAGQQDRRKLEGEQLFVVQACHSPVLDGFD